MTVFALSLLLTVGMTSEPTSTATQPTVNATTTVAQPATGTTATQGTQWASTNLQDDPCSTFGFQAQSWLTGATNLLNAQTSNAVTENVIKGVADLFIELQNQLAQPTWAQNTNQTVKQLGSDVGTQLTNLNTLMQRGQYVSASQTMLDVHASLVLRQRLCQTSVAIANTSSATHNYSVYESNVPANRNSMAPSVANTNAPSVRQGNQIGTTTFSQCGHDPIVPRTLWRGVSAVGGSVNCDFYTVAQGDTLWRVAWAFGHDTESLAQANNLSNPDRIEIGQVIRIRFDDQPAYVTRIQQRTNETYTTQPTRNTGTQQVPVSNQTYTYGRNTSNSECNCPRNN